jgi:simple sugar transport system ATP-binding protein
MTIARPQGSDDRASPQMAASALEPVLKALGISKSFGAVRALRNVDFHVRTGEVVGLLGDNGAGKSTLVSVLSGLIAQDSGSIFVRGVEQTFENPMKARLAGIETVFQNLSLIPSLDIAENVFLNRELYHSGVFRLLKIMDKSGMEREVAAGLDNLGLRLPAPQTKVAALSGGQRQAVAVARAVMWRSDILLLDEPSAALGTKQTEIVLSLIERLKVRNVAIVLISHNLPQVMRVADRIVVMRLGEKVMDTARASCTAGDIVSHMTGAQLPIEDGLTTSHSRDEPA